MQCFSMSSLYTGTGRASGFSSTLDPPVSPCTHGAVSLLSSMIHNDLLSPRFSKMFLLRRRSVAMCVELRDTLCGEKRLYLSLSFRAPARRSQRTLCPNSSPYLLSAVVFCVFLLICSRRCCSPAAENRNCRRCTGSCTMKGFKIREVHMLSEGEGVYL
jgi:hypothetical protein